MSDDELELILEALLGCWSELSAMEDTDPAYVVAGHLEEQVEEARNLLETALGR